jgi:signal peptidase I
MEDTLLVGDFLLVNKFIYGARVPILGWRFPEVRDPERGDIIVFRAPHVDKDFIKRCVAVGGDVVEMHENVLYVNGQAVDEPYIKLEGRPPPVADMSPRRVPDGYLFMLGDNRNNSQDSRYWGFLDVNRLKGKAFVLYWSWDSSRHRIRFNRIGDIIR